MARCGSDADCLQREEEKWGEERVSETQRQNFWLLFWLLGQVNIFHNSPFRSGELFFLYRASFGCRMQPITVVHYPSAEALTGQPLFHPSCARVFFPLYIPVCSCSRPCLKQRVPRQLVLTTASSAAARWHPLGLSPPEATARCKHLHAGMGDEQAGRSCQTHPERMWLFPSCSYFGKRPVSME